MTTKVESVLREGLKELAVVPQPVSLADRALNRAASIRRRRVTLGVIGVVALAALVAIPLLISGTGTTPVGGGGGGGCKTVTDESDPPHGVPVAEWPDFVTLTVRAMPPRTDYTLQSGYGVCPRADATGEAELAYAVINLGPSRENGHVTISLRHETLAACADVPKDVSVSFCDEPTATSPLVFGMDPSDTAALKAVVTSPDLAALFS
jgi:hypothetical protein